MDINNIILKVLNKSASQEELSILKQWKESNNQNIETLESYQNIWNESDGLKTYEDFKSENAFEKLEEKMPKTNNWFYIFGFIFILLSLTYLAYNYFEAEEKPTEFVAESESINFALEDNSNIWLNKTSRLDILSSFEDSRDVSLEGEAFFKVAKNPDKSFTVQLGENRFLKVLGTSFNIKNNEIFEIYVEEGKVAVYDSNKKIELEAGDFLKESAGTLVKYRKDSKNYIAWQSKQLFFENDKVSDVLKDISNAYGVNIEISSQIMNSDCNLRTKYIGESLENILKELVKIFELKFDLKGDTYQCHSINC